MLSNFFARFKKNSAPVAPVVEAPKPAPVTRTEKPQPTTAEIIDWTANIAVEVGEIEADVIAILSEAKPLRSWADMLAVLESENFHTVRYECKRRLSVTEDDIFKALVARYGG